MAKTQRFPISLIILSAAHDLERAQRCRRSVPWVSEVKIITPPMQVTDFAAERNQAIQGAQYPWVLMLDADEEVKTINLVQLSSLLNDEAITAIEFRRQDIFLGKPLRWGEVRNIRVIRLFRHQQVRFHRRVHEIPIVAGIVQPTNWVIAHTAHTSIAHFWQKMIQYVEIETALRQAEGKGFSWGELAFLPAGKFFYNYVLSLGFLDGWRGFCYALVMSVHSLGIRLRLYELEQERS